ncbi:MAG: ABC transporter, partial [Cellvibrionales bacterium]
AFNRDYTMILGTTVFFAALIIFFNLLSDILAIWLNPKLRQQVRGDAE